MSLPVRDVLLNDNGDRVLVAGDYGLASGSQAVKQGITGNVLLYLAEYWLDMSLGVDYFGQVLIRNPSAIVVKSVIGRAIASTPDVTQVVAAALVEVDSSTRGWAITYSAVTNAGNIDGIIAQP